MNFGIFLCKKFTEAKNFIKKYSIENNFWKNIKIVLYKILI